MSDKYPTAGLKPCPFCGQDVHPDYDFPQYVIHQTNKNGFNHSRLFMNRNDWNIRPIEDELRARIAELEAEIDQLTAHDAAERQDDKWIPISENPTKSDWYLIMYQGYRVPDAGYYDVEAGWLSDIPIPDYWMPLPNPPEVK